jgi:transcriptional regulator with XRE-family HTH domain
MYHNSHYSHFVILNNHKGDKTMFKENFVRLCNQRGESPTVVCKKIGITSSAFSKWTDESIPRQATLIRIADYFGTTVAYLTGVVDDPDPIALVDPSKKEPPMLERLNEMIQNMNKEELEDLEKFVEFLLSKKKG